MTDRNREIYGGEGTALLGVGAQADQANSFATASSIGSVQDSSDAPVPFTTASAAPPSFDTIRSLNDRQGAAQLAESKMERYLNEADDECPWGNFLEKSITSDAADEDSGLFGPPDMEDSMQNNVPLSSGDRSMLSSFMSSLQTPSVGMSDVLRNAGARFPSRRGSDRENCYLRLN